MILQELTERELIRPPDWLPNNVCYLTIMGSFAYGVSSDTSDMDLYGFAIPRKEVIFPHLAGVIKNFGYQGENFDQWQQHGVEDKSALGGKGRVYDFTVFSIIKYFELLMDNNPNVLDSIFTSQECILYINQVGNIVRDNRKLFLHKGCFKKFKGYAYSQMKKIKTKEHDYLDEVWAFEQAYGLPNTIKYAEVLAEMNQRELPLKPYNNHDYQIIISLIEKAPKSKPDSLSALGDNILMNYCKIYQAMVQGSKRAERVKIAGFDLKFSYHLVRLLSECEQIFMHGDLDLMQNREQLKAIRRGDMSLKDIEAWATEKEKQLEALYVNSKLPEKPDEAKIKQILLNCLEHQYGNLANVVHTPDKYENVCLEIRKLLNSV